MAKSTLAGLAAAILVVLAISYAVSGAPTDAALLEQINPSLALNGLAFGFAFGWGAPVVLAFMLAAAILLLPAYAAFWVVTWLLGGRR